MANVATPPAKGWYMVYCDGKYVACVEDWKLISTEPSAEVATVRHGRWLKNGSRYCECSVCHREGNTSGADNYCWFCGARMDGDIDD